MPSTPSAQDGNSSQHDQVNTNPGTSTEPHQCAVSDQITDCVALTNVATLGAGPGYAALQSMLGQTQSQNILMANMVSAQKQNAMIGMTTMTQSIQQLINRRNH